MYRSWLRELKGRGHCNIAGISPKEPKDAAPTFLLYVGPHTDVWALGVLLYRVLTGATPFVGDSMVQLMARIASQPVRDPRKHDPSLPPGLVEVCLRARGRTSRRWSWSSSAAMRWARSGVR